MGKLINRVFTGLMAAVAVGPSAPYPGKYMSWVKVGDEGFAQDVANIRGDFEAAIRSLEAEYGEKEETKAEIPAPE